MITQFIDICRKFYNRYRRASFLLSAIVIFSAIYLSSLNRNLLYLSLLFALFLAVSSVVERRKIMFAILVLCIFFAIVPVKVPEVKFVSLASYEVTAREIVKGCCASLLPKETWQYFFNIDDLDKHQAECGHLQGRLLVDGLDLAGLVIKVKGNVSADFSPSRVKKHYLEQIQLPIEVDTPGRIEVFLTAEAGSSPKIYIVGPEIHGFNIYNDAVWLEFKNQRCSVLFHAQRQNIPAQSVSQTK